jgi:taurine dioxygenase
MKRSEIRDSRKSLGSPPDCPSLHPAYVDRDFTRHIVGIPCDDAMLNYLYQHAECRFRRTENAIAFWDNRCAKHRAMWDYCRTPGTRVMVKGERPV